MPNTDLTQLNSSINTFLKIIKGKVNDKDFSYDDKGLEDAIEYATQLMRDKKPVNFEWEHTYEKLEKLGPLMAVARIASGVGRSAGKGLKGAKKVGFEVGTQPLPTINKQKGKSIQKIDPAMAALAGWWVGGTVDELNQQRAKLSPSQQNEFDRQIERALMRGRGFRKDISLEKLQSLFKTKPISPGTAAPPKAGLSWDPTSHRWVNPKTKLQGAISARKGKKRTRGTGTGVGEKKVKVGTRMIGAGRRFKGETDVAVKKKKIKLPSATKK